MKSKFLFVFLPAYYTIPIGVVVVEEIVVHLPFRNKKLEQVCTKHFMDMYYNLNHS